MSNLKIQLLYILIGTSAMLSCGDNSANQPKAKDTWEVTKKATPAEPQATTATQTQTADPTTEKIIEKTVEANPTDEALEKQRLERAEQIFANIDPSMYADVDAKKVYKMYCSNCHGIKGDMEVNGAKDLRKSKLSAGAIAAQVYFGKGLMTPFRGVLKDEEVMAVSKYVESLRN
jgi:mono/diheme cytochrome c family protein